MSLPSIVVDTAGHLPKVVVHPAYVQDRDDVWDVFEAMAGHFPNLSLVWSDRGDTRNPEDLRKFHFGWRLEIAKRALQKRAPSAQFGCKDSCLVHHFPKVHSPRVKRYKAEPSGMPTTMGQVLHGSARTTETVRCAIQNSQASVRALERV
jgi:hypothetical protein